MEFSADTKSLADALEQVQGAVDKKSTIPILSHALVEASATGLHGPPPIWSWVFGCSAQRR